MDAERVGLILSSGEVVELVNINQEPTQSFSVAPEDMIKYEDQTVATWHTHPNTPLALSGEDYLGFLMWPAFLHLIIKDDDIKGFTVNKGMVLNDARKDHPAWSFTRDLAARLRVRSSDPLGSDDGPDGHAQDSEGSGK